MPGLRFVSSCSVVAVLLSVAAVRAEDPKVRIQPTTTYEHVPAARSAAWSRFTRELGPWRALWDADTGAPLRIFGSFVQAPHTFESGALAEAHARAFLARFGDLLAPGASADDFELTANDLDGATRTVAFEQRMNVPTRGLVRVEGARVSFRYRNDRLFLIGSEASASTAHFESPRITPDAAAIAAQTSILDRHAFALAKGAPGLAVVRLIRRGSEEVRLAFVVHVEASAPHDDYDVAIDAMTGLPLSRTSHLRHVAEPLLLDAPVRGPDGARANYPAVLLDVTVDGAESATDADGNITWSGAPGSKLETSVHGNDVIVMNQAGAEAMATFPLGGSQLLWSLAADEFGDAQIASYVHGGVALAYARGIAPDMEFLAEPLVLKPNETNPNGCDAYWDGMSFDFFRQTPICNNTARIADVVYHEFGHAFHEHAIIPGAGALDPALGEGTADYLAVTITGDPNLAPGFFIGKPTTPLRSVDLGARWPEDISSDPHITGLIWSGAMWDLRSALSTELGVSAGVALADQLYYQAIRRAPNIPATYAEVLAADDDDGDLGNGTPHVCAINAAFAKHGLSGGLDASGLELAHVPLTVVPGGGAPYPIVVTAIRPYPQCASSTVSTVRAVVTVGDQRSTTVDLTPDGDTFRGSIPGQPEGTQFNYHLEIVDGGVTTRLPDNAADPDYDVYAGAVKTLYCTDFESDPKDWAFGGDFAWGESNGNGGDPDAAYSGKHVIGTQLGGDGLYALSEHAFARSPVIDVNARDSVHLQYRRWLTVEDGFYDQATIAANGTIVWRNVGTNESNGKLDLLDLEWRFEDIDVSAAAAEGSIQVEFDLTSDPTNVFGGWNVDDVCLVSVASKKTSPKPPASVSAQEPSSGCAIGSVTPERKTAAAWMAAAALALVASARRRRV